MSRGVFFDVSSFNKALNGSAGGWFTQRGIWNVGAGVPSKVAFLCELWLMEQY